MQHMKLLNTPTIDGIGELDGTTESVGSDGTTTGGDETSSEL